VDQIGLKDHVDSVVGEEIPVGEALPGGWAFTLTCAFPVIEISDFGESLVASLKVPRWSTSPGHYRHYFWAMF